MERIAFTDIDGHTVKLTHEEVAQCLADMGNDYGKYLLIPAEFEVPDLGSSVVLAIRCSKRPSYSWLQLWQKRRKGSVLLERKVAIDFQGTQNTVDVNAKPVWLRLKHNETHVIEVC